MSAPQGPTSAGHVSGARGRGSTKAPARPVGYIGTCRPLEGRQGPIGPIRPLIGFWTADRPVGHISGRFPHPAAFTRSFFTLPPAHRRRLRRASPPPPPPPRLASGAASAAHRGHCRLRRASPPLAMPCATALFLRRARREGAGGGRSTAARRQRVSFFF